MSSLDFLHGVQTVEIDDGIRPIQTAKSSIIGLVGTAGKGPVNTPALVTGNLRDGVLQFGAYGDDGFTIPEALVGIYDQIGAMCIVVNVCDPSRHTTTITNETITFNNRFVAKSAHPFISAVSLGTAWAALANVTVPAIGAKTITLPVGATPTSLKSADGLTTYVLNSDYTVASNVITLSGALAAATTVDGTQLLVGYTGTAVLNVDYTLNLETGAFTRIPGKMIMPQATGRIASYTYVDPTKVTDADVIGGVQADGTYTGVYALYGSETLWEVVPRILIAPHYMHQKANAITANPVVSALLAVANRLKAIIFADAPNTNDQAAIAYRVDWGSDRIMVVDPFFNTPGPYGTGFKADGVTPWLVPSSVYWAGITAMVDNKIGFWKSPSNELLSGVIGLGRTIEWSLSDPNSRANYLNSEQISVAIRKDGFRTWGNHSTTVDPKWTFLCVRRTADMIEESIQQAHLWAVDRVIDKNFFTEVIGSVNAYLRYLTALGAIYGGKSWADRSLNTNEVIASGQVYIDYDFTAPYPAEHITFRAHLVNDYIAAIFKGLAQDITVGVPTTGA